jgi:hypothetical protein
MQLFARRCETLAVIAVLCSGSHIAHASTITPSVVSSTLFVLPTVTSPLVGTCEFRTINYITHNLPQVCLRYARSDSASLESPHATTTATDETTPPPSGTAEFPFESGISAEELAIADSDADAREGGSS